MSSNTKTFEISLSDTPMLVQKIPRQFSSPSTINLFPEPKNFISKISVQRRWVYPVAEATS